MSNQKRGIARIGTSGVVVPGSKKTFPAEFRLKSRLNYYSSLFNTLEINSTFQKIPMISTFEKWSLDVPEDFRFTIKLWKEITHVKQLKIDFQNIENFLTAASHIGNRKGCLLIQFPGSITTEYRSEVENILQRLQVLDFDNQWRKAIEFRSVTWYGSETYKFINAMDATIVLHDMPKSKNLELDEPSKFSYVRFHGPKGDYRGGYSLDFLKTQAKKIDNWLNDGKDVYVYFNNTMGDAFENAMSLKSMIEQ